MLKENRKQVILDQLEMNDMVKICDLLDVLDVTEMTLWRDLKELEDDKKIIRMRGGAKRVTPLITANVLHSKRMMLNSEKKKQIAQKAAALIQDRDVIFISSSTTNEYLCEYIKSRNVKVITNSTTIYRQYVSNPNYETILIGGKLDAYRSSFLGVIANDILSTMSFSKAFLGTNGISQKYCSASNYEEGALYKIVLDNATEKYVVCDSTKFNKDAFYRYYACDKLTAIISDDGEIEQRERYEQYTKIL